MFYFFVSLFIYILYIIVFFFHKKGAFDYRNLELVFGVLVFFSSVYFLSVLSSGTLFFSLFSGAATV